MTTTSRRRTTLLGAALTVGSALVAAPASATALADFRNARCSEPDRTVVAGLEVPAEWEKSQPGDRTCYFTSPDRSLRLKVDLGGRDTTVRHVRQERRELIAASEDNDYREKRWSVKGKEVRWVFASRNHTFRIALSKSIRVQLGSFNAENDRADLVMRRALRSLVVGRSG